MNCGCCQAASWVSRFGRDWVLRFPASGSITCPRLLLPRPAQSSTSGKRLASTITCSIPAPSSGARRSSASSRQRGAAAQVLPRTCPHSPWTRALPTSAWSRSKRQKHARQTPRRWRPSARPARRTCGGADPPASRSLRGSRRWQWRTRAQRHPQRSSRRRSSCPLPLQRLSPQLPARGGASVPRRSYRPLSNTTSPCPCPRSSSPQPFVPRRPRLAAQRLQAAAAGQRPGSTLPSAPSPLASPSSSSSAPRTTPWRARSRCGPRRCRSRTRARSPRRS